MPSQLKSDTARANGAKSRGPKTPETRAKSSRNSLKHGLTATTRHSMVLACERTEEFQALVDEYTSMYQPANFAERNLVDDMIAATWRISRLRLIEVALTDYEVSRPRPEFEQKLTDFDAGIHLGLSFRALCDESRSMSLLSRYQSRLHRIHTSAQKSSLDFAPCPGGRARRAASSACFA